MKTGQHVIIDRIMESFVPVRKRPWYPWVWPDSEWWAKTSRDNPREVMNFTEKVRKYAREDLFFFCNEILRESSHLPLHVGLHDEICHLLQSGENIGILIPRNTLKTTIGSVGYTLWLLGNDSTKRVFIISATLDLSCSVVTSIGEHVKLNKKLKIVFPDLQPAEHSMRRNMPKKWSGQELHVKRTSYSKEPSVLAIGLDKQPKTGFHCDIAIYDDMVTKENANSAERMKEVYENYMYSLSLPDGLAKKTQQIINGTRYHDADPYGSIINEGKIPFYIRKAIEDGAYCWPTPNYVKRVQDQKEKLTAYLFSCQYQNDPITEGNAEFDAKWIQRWTVQMVREEMGADAPASDEELLRKWYGTLNIYVGCDPARTEKKRSDYTVILACGMDARERLFVLDFVRQKMRTDAVIDAFISMFDKWKPITGKLETYGGDIHVFNGIRKKMQETARPYFKIGQYPRTAHQSGEDRIRALIYPFSQKLVYLGVGPEWADFEDELLRFPFARHDDLITTLAYIREDQAKPKPYKVKEEPLGEWQSRRRGYRKHGRAGSWMTA